MGKPCSSRSRAERETEGREREYMIYLFNKLGPMDGEALQQQVQGRALDQCRTVLQIQEKIETIAKQEQECCPDYTIIYYILDQCKTGLQHQESTSQSPMPTCYDGHQVVK